MAQRFQPTEEWRKLYPKGKAPLSWNRADYDAWGIKPPNEIDAGKTEGELMRDEELAEWVKDSVATIRIFLETEPLRGAELYADFVLDVQYLNELGKVGEEMIDFALDEGNFKWYDQSHE